VTEIASMEQALLATTMRLVNNSLHHTHSSYNVLKLFFFS
jgi:hypothetical protein